MKKLMIIVPNLRLGGQERVAVNTAIIMSEVYEVVLITFDNSESAYDWKGKIIDIKVPAKEGKLFKIINVQQRVSKIKKLKKELDIEYSISFGESANIVNVLSKDSEKVITSVRGYTNLSARLMDRYIYGHSDIVICCSNEIKVKFDKLFRNMGKSRVLYNPYDIDLLKTLGKEEVTDIDFSRNIIITHGRLEKVKNYTRLIKAFSVVKEEIRDTSLVIIGEGSERNRLESLVKILGLENSVRLIGFRRNPFAYISKSVLYVLSSLNEGFPNALVEGMVFLPVVAVDCKSGPREILNAEIGGEKCINLEEAQCGILVKQSEKREQLDYIDEDDIVLADAIIKILKDKNRLKQYRDVAVKRVADFSFEHYRRELTKILEER